MKETEKQHWGGGGVKRGPGEGNAFEAGLVETF